MLNSEEQYQIYDIGLVPYRELHTQIKKKTWLIYKPGLKILGR